MTLRLVVDPDSPTVTIDDPENPHQRWIAADESDFVEVVR